MVMIHVFSVESRRGIFHLFYPRLLIPQEFRAEHRMTPTEIVQLLLIPQHFTN